MAAIDVYTSVAESIVVSNLFGSNYLEYTVYHMVMPMNLDTTTNSIASTKLDFQPMLFLRLPTCPYLIYNSSN